MIPAAACLIVLLIMLAELSYSRRNERALRRRHAYEPPHDVYFLMAWAYPLAFAAMACEGVIRHTRWASAMAAGVVLLVLAKLLKVWAIAALGGRWTFRVLVLPEPLVDTGPYAFVRHPNYIAVIGEMLGFALLAGAPFTGTVSLVGFGELLRRRIAVEDGALKEAGYPPCT